MPGLPSISLPFNDPVLIFAIAMVVFLTAPLLLEQFELPGIIAVLLVGVLIGPHTLGLLNRSNTIVLLGTVGLLYLMFVSGLEIDINDFLENPSRSAIFALITFSLPMVLGTISGVVILQFSVIAAILFASIFSSHTLLGYPIVEQLDIVKNNAVTTTISATILTDTVALLILTVIENLHSQSHIEILFWVEFTLKLAIFFVGVWIAVPRLGRWFFRNVDEESYFEFLFVMAVLFVTAYLANLAGAEPIIGAFLAGLTLNRLIPSTSTLQNRIDFVGNALFIPFFLLSTGMIVQPNLFLKGIQPWVIAGTILAIMLGTKLAAAWLTSRIYGFERPEWLTMFGLSTGQASAALAIAFIGTDLGLFTTATVNGVVLMILIAGIISPYLAERYGREVVAAEETKEYEPSEAPERILIPLTKYTDNTGTLLDLSILLHASESEEPIHALTVVEEKGQNLDIGKRYTTTNRSEADGADTHDQQAGGDQQTEGEVADAEQTLEKAEEHAVSAEIPIDTQTRVAENVVTGIVRAIKDNRITTVIMGWNNQRRFGHRLFGTTIDQLLDRTNEFILVANLAEPINTIERLVIVLPGRITTHPGLSQGVFMAKRLTEQLGVPSQYFIIDGGVEQYENLITSVEPEVPFELEAVNSWRAFRSETSDQFKEGDLAIALLPREGARGWESYLKRLPHHLASHGPDNVVVAYLPEEEQAYQRQFFQID